MILIWSGEGGPLQYLSVALVFLQFFAPQLLRLAAELHAGGGDFGGNNGGSADHGGRIPLVWVACALFTAIFVGGMWVIGEVLCWSWRADELDGGLDAVDELRVDDNNNNNEDDMPAAAEATPSGTAANPVVIDDDDDDSLWTFIVRLCTRATAGIASTNVMLALALLLPLAMAVPLLNAGGIFWGESPSLGGGGGSIVQVTVLAIVAHSMMAIAAYRVLREVVDGGGVGPYPGTQRGRRRRGRKLTVSDIADIVRKVPAEEFVSEEAVRTGDCSVARMKRMLVNRGASEAAKKCVERDDLVREVERVRKFNEECAICAEEYAEGDVLRVPHCQHEFHLHCFDKWIYTFSTDSRPATHPTCPLCKATIQ